MENNEREELISKYLEQYGKYNRNREYIESNLDVKRKTNSCKECFEVGLDSETIVTLREYKYKNEDGSKDTSHENNPMMKSFHLKFVCPTCNSTWNANPEIVEEK